MSFSAPPECRRRTRAARGARQQLHTVDPAESSRCNASLSRIQGHFAEALWTQPGQLDGRGHRHQCLVRADIRGRPFPADVLFARSHVMT